MRALEQLSGGRITVTVASSYENGSVSAESDIVKAIAHDTFDGGWPTTRAFARADIRGLEAVEAPMTLTSYAAEKALVSGPSSTGLLKTLTGTGVLGLGLIVGPLRRPFSTATPLDAVQGWNGVTFRTYNSPVQEATARALGAVPVSASYTFPELVRAGTAEGRRDRCGAVRSQRVRDAAAAGRGKRGAVAPRAGPGLQPEALRLAEPHRTGLGTGRPPPRPYRRQLSYHYDENGPALTLCKQGVRFLYCHTSAADCAEDGRATRAHANLRMIRQPHPDSPSYKPWPTAHPTPDTIDVPSTCQGG